MSYGLYIGKNLTAEMDTGAPNTVMHAEVRAALASLRDDADDGTKVRVLVLTGVEERPGAAGGLLPGPGQRRAVGQVAGAVGRGVARRGPQVTAGEADVSRCVGIGTGHGRCLRRSKPRPVPSPLEAYRG